MLVSLSRWELNKLSVAVTANGELLKSYCAGNRRHQRQSESAVCLHHPDPGLCHHPAPSPSLLLTLPVAAKHKKSWQMSLRKGPQDSLTAA